MAEGSAGSRIEYTKHAKERMESRGISEGQARLTILEPIRSSREYDEPEKWAFRRRWDDKLLVVIAYVRGNGFKVKTAYYE